jgi:hypothetical protein
MARMNGNRRTQQRSTRTQNSQEREPREYKEIFGVTQRGDQSFWTRIGVAFVNADDSLNLVFNFLPTDPDTTIQIRDPRPREE